MNSTKQKNGFTIIEVVLVLAIAALIFLMIFVALPALQRGQANTARKNDVSTIASAVTSYRSNHRGSLESLTTSKLRDYVDNLSQIDTGSVTVEDTLSEVSGADALNTATVFIEAKCNEDNQAESGSLKQAAVVSVVELSGDKVEAVCQDA